MSYSRWINSCWYTYASTKGGFDAWLVGSSNNPNYTNEQVKQMLDGDWSPLVDETTEEQRKELREYMLACAWAIYCMGRSMRLSIIACMAGYLCTLLNSDSGFLPIRVSVRKNW